MLNEQLDLDAIRDEYQSTGFVRIENTLAPDAAERVHSALTTEVAWELCYLGTNGPISYTSQQLGQMQPAQLQALNQEILTRAQSGFSYFYFRSNLPTTPSPTLRDFYAFIRSPAFLDATRHIAQDEAINNATGQVTCYRNANFLRVHTDHNPKEDRRAAYVFGFTRYWENDWGGLLNIMNAERRIVAAHKPGFNTLTLFKVPQPHFVSQVSNFAQGQRLTATGWLIVEYIATTCTPDGRWPANRPSLRIMTAHIIPSRIFSGPARRSTRPDRNRTATPQPAPAPALRRCAGW